MDYDLECADDAALAAIQQEIRPRPFTSDEEKSVRQAVA
jgi:hypothetical protein